MSPSSRIRLTFWQGLTVFGRGYFGPHLLALIVLVLGAYLVAGGLALADLAGLFPAAKPSDASVPGPPPGPPPEPAAANMFLTAASLWGAFVLVPLLGYLFLIARLADVVDGAADRVLQVRAAADG